MGFKLLNGELVALTPEEEEALATPPPVPAEVPMWKALTIMRLTPLGEGTLYSAVLAFLAAIPDADERDLATILFDKAPNLRRDAPLVSDVSAAFGLTDEHIDDLFRAASALA